MTTKTTVDCETCKYYEFSIGDFGLGEWCFNPKVRKKFQPHTLQGFHDPRIINERHDCVFYEENPPFNWMPLKIFFILTILSVIIYAIWRNWR